jgi:hypothetical protein
MPQTPPRFVPTLTQVVAPNAPAAATAGANRANQASASQASSSPLVSSVALTTGVIAQQMRQKLLVHMRQQIDLQLHKRIRETVSQVALEHAYKMYEELQPQIEAVVVEVVEEAMKQAIAKASLAPLSSGPGGAADVNAPLKI